MISNKMFAMMEDMHTFLKEGGKYDPKALNILYHYCPVDTMLKILQNYCIWLSDAEKTNDKNELKYFAEQVEKMILNIVESYQGEVNSDLLTLEKKENGAYFESK